MRVNSGLKTEGRRVEYMTRVTIQLALDHVKEHNEIMETASALDNSCSF